MFRRRNREEQRAHAADLKAAVAFTRARVADLSAVLAELEAEAARYEQSVADGQPDLSALNRTVHEAERAESEVHCAFETATAYLDDLGVSTLRHGISGVPAGHHG